MSLDEAEKEERVPARPRQNFVLSKWYADCTTEDGDAFILYSAELQWRGPAIHYTSLLEHLHGHPTCSRFSLHGQSMPEARDGRIDWRSRAWNAEGRWSHLGAGLREVLFESPGGSLEWECVAPRSYAELRIGGGEWFRGWGYVEHLRLSVVPWRLPIRQLRWGRFINAADAVVWIDWRGPENRRIVYCNGAAVSAQTIADHEIVLADAVLELNPVAVLREGHLGSTALAVLPGSDRLFPARMLNVREQKWLSRAALRRPGRRDSIGIAIHEVVEWP